MKKTISRIKAVLRKRHDRQARKTVSLKRATRDLVKLRALRIRAGLEPAQAIAEPIRQLTTVELRALNKYRRRVGLTALDITREERLAAWQAKPMTKAQKMRQKARYLWAGLTMCGMTLSR